MASFGLLLTQRTSPNGPRFKAGLWLLRLHMPKLACVFALRAYRPLPLGFQQHYLTVWGKLDSRCVRVQYAGPP